MTRRTTLVVACVLLAGGVAGAQDTARVLRRRTTAEDLQLFSQVLNQIRVNHADSVDSHDLFQSAIVAMVRAADPHSYVIPAIRLDSTRAKAYEAGKLVSIPVDFRYVGETPLVTGVNAGSRAAGLDILPGDELVLVNGRTVTAESEFELEVFLAGEPKSTVDLTFERRRADGSLVRLERRVQRERAKPESAIPAPFMLDSTTGYVRVTTFDGDKVADDLNDALGKLESSGIRQLILDLRDNGGGRVDQAAKVAGAFLPKGALVYTMSGRHKDLTDTARVGRSFWRSERRYPVIVLVNDGTASASELVAGALQDHDRALIAGRTTFGKALVMQTFPLSDGSLMALVTGRIHTPCGRIVQRTYHGVKARDYYRDAGRALDTAGRPSCRTDGGRVVYGGGGVVPDAGLTAAADVPNWLARAREAGLTTRWAGGWAGAAAVKSAVDLARQPLPAVAIDDFRKFAKESSIDIPTDSASVALLDHTLAKSLAWVRFGESGFYQVSALLDPQVREAIALFPRAAMLPGVRQSGTN